MMEEICDMADPKKREQANRLFDKVLDEARELIKADGGTNENV